MKRVIIGFLIGVVVLVLFIYFGGAKYLRIFGIKTEEAGTRLESVEKRMKEGAKTAKKTVNKTAEKVKRLVP